MLLKRNVLLTGQKGIKHFSSKAEFLWGKGHQHQDIKSEKILKFLIKVGEKGVVHKCCFEAAFGTIILLIDEGIIQML